MASDATPTIAPANPVRQSASLDANNAIKACGNGSQTVPICNIPGVRVSTNRRAILRCAMASP